MEAQPTQEYRYSQTTQQRAGMWLALSSILLIALGVVLFLRWFELGLFAQVLGLLLLIGLLFTVRAQLGRIFFRCRIETDQLKLHAPLNHRAIPWPAITEVRRTRLPRVGATQRWACTVITRSARDTPIPIFVFDDQLEQAEQALHAIVQHTPHAQHQHV